jgi:excisionase family DNA binding protein
MAIDHSERLLTVDEVAERLRVHPITVRRHIKAGRLRAVRIGRSVRVRPHDLEVFEQPQAKPSMRLPYRWPPTDEEVQRRTRLLTEMIARRDARPPLGTTTDELIRASREYLERRTRRSARHRG